MSYRAFWAALLFTASLGGCSRQTGLDPQANAHANEPGGAFRLTDTQGRTVTDKTLEGKPYALFFGFTRCPDACPTTMARMALLKKRMGGDADKLNVVFVSVDPEHDKPADVASFLSMFSVPVIGLTGTPAELEKLERQDKIYVSRVALPNGDYTIDHTAVVLLFDSHGRFVETMDPQEDTDRALRRLERLVDA